MNAETPRKPKPPGTGASTRADRGREVDVETEERDDAIIGIALRWSLVLIALLLLVGGGVAYWMTRPAPPPPVRQTELAVAEIREAQEVAIPFTPFTEITEAAGIDFVHVNGAAGEKLLPETMGSGCGFFDFDRDGDEDLLLINSKPWPWTSDDKAPRQALYRNDGDGKFTDATAGSGLDVSLYGVGTAIGDYDNDGLPDIFISAVGENRLFHNEGGGKFQDVTAQAGVAGEADDWGTSCGWFDYDRDGDLDLFVCNYVSWSPDFDRSQLFQLTGGSRAYGRPQNFEGSFPYLYRNDGEGKFTDVTADAGLQIRTPTTADPMAKSLGVTFADFDRDGWLDIIVANDTVQNFLFHNQQNGTFDEFGAPAGIAFDMDGNARGAMGIDVASFRNDDGLGIAIGNFSNEMTALYVSEGGEMTFVDEAISSGLGPSTRLLLTFGIFYFDYDLNGRLDLFAANGHLEDEINRVQPSQHYKQPPQLFWNCGPEFNTEFLPVSQQHCGEDLVEPMVARGASFADIDNDGDLDILITAVGDKPRLLRNDQQLGHHWLRIRLEGTSSNRDGIGSLVEVTLPGEGTTLRQRVMPTRSYASQVELPVTFGLGEVDAIEKVTVTWSDGSRQEVSGLQVDQMHTIKQP